jgi:hypothetical protein
MFAKTATVLPVLTQILLAAVSPCVAPIALHKELGTNLASDSRILWPAFVRDEPIAMMVSGQSKCFGYRQKAEHADGADAPAEMVCLTVFQYGR